MKYITEPENILDLIKTNNIFLTGQPGSGKSWITKKYIDMIGTKNTGITASTGIAAKILNGVTIHSWSGIDIIEKEDTFDTILKRVLLKPSHVKRWKNTEVLIIDEISLLDSKTFIILDSIGKEIRKSTKPFGGIRLLVVGDFYQLPPVNGNICFESTIWEDTFDYGINLCTSYRSSDDKLNRILKCIRKCKPLKPNMLLVLKKRTSKKVLANIKYPILVPLRDMARNINNKNLLKNENKEYIFNAKYTGLKETAIKLSPLEDKLVLKVGCPVIYLCNDRMKGLVNGMVGTVIDFIDDKPIVKFANRNHTIDKHLWKKDNLSMEQFPLLLGYAITIHRSQGQTLSQASITLDKRMWEKSQSYVALSRLQNLDGLNLISFDPNVFNIINGNDIKVREYYKKWEK